MLRRLLFAALGSIAMWLPSGVLAALPSGGHVKASLVAADTAIHPGKPLTVALRLLHDPHWHTYWLQPGTGLPTTLQWTRPPGWKAGEIQWPAPVLLKDRSGNIVGNGYEKEMFLPVTLTPPANLRPGEMIELKVAADWLECADICIPGGAKLSLTLPASAEPPPPDRTWADKIRATIEGLPREDPSWKLSAGRDGKMIVLKVAPAGAPAHAPKDLHFFSMDNLVGFDLPQKVTADGRGGFTLTLQSPPEAPASATHLVGVLTSESGWLPGSKLRGLRVNLPLGKVDSTVAARNLELGTQNAEPRSSATTLLLAFIGGLILNLMPCVFPVLGIKILGFVNQAGHQRGRIAAHGLVFTGGVLASFWALAGLLAVLRAGGDQLGWGFQLQSPAFVYALAVLLLAFGMNLSGVFEFGLSATAVGSGLQSKSGYAGSFFTGVLATVVATPCSAPFLAPALGAALAVSTAQSFVIFTAIAVGLSLPYLLLSAFPQFVKVLPRPGGWMETFKQFMAFPLYATVGYLVWVLAGQVTDDAFLSILFSLVVVALAVWMYGRWHAPGASAARARLGLVALLVVGAFGLWVGWPRAASAAASNVGGAAQIVWEPWSAEAVAKHRAAGRLVYVDFTARWCATCQTNKKLVFSSDAVLRYLADHKVATLRADWTNKDPRITAELAAYNRSAVPFNLIWAPGRDEPIILPELLTPGTVLDALKKAATPVGGEKVAAKDSTLR